MANSNRRAPARTGDDWLYKRIEELERKVEQIDNRAYPTVPIYDYDALPDDPIEGQIAVIANAPDFTLEGMGIAAGAADLPFAFITGVNGSHPGTGTDIAFNNLFVDMSDSGHSTVTPGDIYANSFGCADSGTNDTTAFSRDYYRPTISGSPATYQYYTLNFHKPGTYLMFIDCYCQSVAAIDPTTIALSIGHGYLSFDTAWSNAVLNSKHGYVDFSNKKWELNIKDILTVSEPTGFRAPPRFTIPSIHNASGAAVDYYLSILAVRIGSVQGWSDDGTYWPVSGASV